MLPRHCMYRMIQAVMPYMRSQGEPSLTEAEQFLREHDQGAIYSEGSEFTTAATPPGKAGLSPKKGGYIINLSSTSGIRGMPAFEYYVSSKFALEGLMDSFRYTAAGKCACERERWKMGDGKLHYKYECSQAVR